MNRFLQAATVALATLTAGCGGSGTKTVAVKGQLITKDGSPFHLSRPGGQPLPPGDPGIRVKFVRLGDTPPGEDASYYASVNADAATFEVPGKGNNGIPPGKYQVIIAVGAAGEPAGGKRAGNGPPGAGAPNMDGMEVAREEVTVPDEGLKDLKLEIPLKK